MIPVPGVPIAGTRAVTNHSVIQQCHRLRGVQMKEK